MSPYLISAKQKRNSDKTVNYDLSLIDFLCQCYVNLAPNAYGKKIEKYLQQQLYAISVPAYYEQGDFFIAQKYFEVKASYLSQDTDSYNITHLRPWQNFDYYLFCFIDCDDDFTPHFYVVDKSIESDIILGYMNGTPNSNKHNDNVEMRATIKRDSYNFSMISVCNKLKDTTYESLKEFIKELRFKSHKSFMSEGCKSN